MCGATSVSIAFIATAASIALPPAARTSAPACVAARCGEAAAALMPPAPPPPRARPAAGGGGVGGGGVPGAVWFRAGGVDHPGVGGAPRHARAEPLLAPAHLL